MPRHSLQECLTLACVLEATAPKPGNVHRGADFDDVTFTDFLVSAVRAAPHLAAAGEIGVGAAALQALNATRELVSTNTNLGMLLLLSPLAAVPRAEPLAAGIQQVLAKLDAHQSQLLWTTIQQAQPGGMGRMPDDDIHSPAPPDIVRAMQRAADRDWIAAQYANGFREVLVTIVPWLVSARESGISLTEAIIHTQIRVIAELGDSLIRRKAGDEIASQASHFAGQVLQAGPAGSEDYHAALNDFDFWLRADGRRRNPGTTADLLAAALFVVLRDERIDPPYR